MKNKTLITIKTYDAIVEKFDKEYCKTIYYKKQLDNFLKRLRKGSKILDIGCGTGHVARYLSKKGFNVVGVDLSERMLVTAKQKSPQSDFYLMDVREIKFKPQSYDAVLCLFVLNHVDHKEAKKVIGKMSKILRKKGHLFIAVPEGEGEEVVPEPLNPRHKMYFSYYQKEFLKKELEKNGLKLLGVEDRYLRKEGCNEFFISAQKI